MVLSGDGNFKAGELVYNKSAPIGLTVTTTTNNVNSTNHYSRSSSKNNPDKNYPVDIRTVNSPEYNNYYGSYDFIGIYGSASAGSKINGATGFIEGYLKGYGFVQYNVYEIGASNGNWASSWQGDRLFGNSTTGRFDQTTLEGWGNQVSGTAEVISVGKWNSYAYFGDMVNNKPSFKGFAIGFNATFSINPKKSGGLGFGVSTSFSNLVKPVKKK